jgi:hypothetical protein
MADGMVRSWWQNILMAVTMLLMALIGAATWFVMIARIAPDSRPTTVTGAAAAVAWAAAWSVLAVRAARLGVNAEQGCLVARGMLRTRRVPCPDVIEVPVVEASNGRGGTYFAPVIVYRVAPEPLGRSTRRELLLAVGVPATSRTASVFLIWLASLSEQGAQRHANRIRVMAGHSGDLRG